MLIFGTIECVDTTPSRVDRNREGLKLHHEFVVTAELLCRYIPGFSNETRP